MKRMVTMCGPLRISIVEAIELSPHLGVAYLQSESTVDLETRQLIKVGPGFGVVHMNWGIGVSPRVPTLYEAINLANWLRDAWDWTRPPENLGEIRAAIRGRLGRWAAGGGWLGDVPLQIAG